MVPRLFGISSTLRMAGPVKSFASSTSHVTMTILMMTTTLMMMILTMMIITMITMGYLDIIGEAMALVSTVVSTTLRSEVPKWFVFAGDPYHWANGCPY